jgi:hypothetical protein
MVGECVGVCVWVGVGVGGGTCTSMGLFFTIEHRQRGHRAQILREAARAAYILDQQSTVGCEHGVDPSSTTIASTHIVLP